MRSAVIINLDYENFSMVSCRRAWDEIEHGMELAGFTKQKRIFLTGMDWKTACQQARAVVSSIENRLADEDIAVFDLIREFYCFEYQQLNDLLDPASNTPEVSFVDTGTFRAFIAEKPSK